MKKNMENQRLQRAMVIQMPDKKAQYGLREGAKEYPMMLVLSVVYPCNALCPHCPYTNSNIRDEYRDAPFMSEEIFKKIADESGPHKAYLRISGGGEPMMYKKTPELLCYAKEKGCQIGLITNGSPFTETNSRALVEAGVDMIEFSVDADNEKDYNVVRKGLVWSRLLRNVERILEIRNKADSQSKIVASGVDQKEVDIEKVEKFWTETMGVDYFIKRKFLTWGHNTSLDDTRSANKDPYLNVENVPCPFIFERLNIDSRGNVMVCGYDIAANTSMGNVTTESIRNIWHGEGFEFYRRKHLELRGGDISLCSSCPDWKDRSWTHNYWQSIEGAIQGREKTLKNLHNDEDFMSSLST